MIIIECTKMGLEYNQVNTTISLQPNQAKPTNQTYSKHKLNILVYFNSQAVLQITK